jgi:hypothetical protein
MVPWAGGGEGGRAWRLATGVAFGGAATGVFRAFDQLLPGLQGALWRPARAFNALIGGLLQWSDESVAASPVGAWCQEGLLFLAVLLLLTWFTRGQTGESARMLGAVAMFGAPWLTNAEGIVIVLANGSLTTRGALSAAMTGSIGAGLLSWLLARRGRAAVAGFTLAGGLLVMLLGIYWLNSPVRVVFQAAALAASGVLFWRTVGDGRSPWASALS